MSASLLIIILLLIPGAETEGIKIKRGTLI